MVLYALFVCGYLAGTHTPYCNAFGGNSPGTVENPTTSLQVCEQLRADFVAAIQKRGESLGDPLVCKKMTLPGWEPLK